MIHFPDTPEAFYQHTQICQFGITEALFGVGLADLFGGAAAATAADVGAGAGIADLAGAGAADLGALAGTSAPTAALASGLEATALPAETAGFGAAADLAAAQAAGTGLATGIGDLAAVPGALAGADVALGGPAVAGTVFDTLAPAAAAGEAGTLAAAPVALDASVFSTGAAPVFAAGGGAAPAAAGGALSSIDALLGPTAQTPGTLSGGTAFGMPDAFSGGNAMAFAPQTGTGVGISPSIAPAGGAPSVAAPAGITAPTDITALSPGSQALGGTGPITAGGPTGPTAFSAPTSSIDSLLGKAGTGAIESLTKNPLPIALGAGGLGYSLYKGMQDTANQKALAADAAQATKNSNQMVASGEALQQYLTSGTLPPQYMAQVDQAIADAKTAAISNQASQGNPTDPKQNTALMETLAKIDNQKPGMISQIASQLFTSGQGLINSGLGAAGLSGQLYQALVQNDTTQAANTGKAIATLAAALNGKSTGTIGGSNITISPA